MLHRLGQPLEESLGRREPALRDGVRAAAFVIPGQRQREARGGQLVARRRVALVGALTQLDRLVEPSRPPRGVAEKLEILGRELGLVEGVVGVVARAPRLSRGSRARRLEAVQNLTHDPRPIVTPVSAGRQSQFLATYSAARRFGAWMSHASSSRWTSSSRSMSSSLICTPG